MPCLGAQRGPLAAKRTGNDETIQFAPEIEVFHAIPPQVKGLCADFCKSVARASCKIASRKERNRQGSNRVEAGGLLDSVWRRGLLYRILLSPNKPKAEATHPICSLPLAKP